MQCKPKPLTNKVLQLFNYFPALRYSADEPTVLQLRYPKMCLSGRDQYNQLLWWRHCVQAVDLFLSSDHFLGGTTHCTNTGLPVDRHLPDTHPASRCRAGVGETKDAGRCFRCGNYPAISNSKRKNWIYFCRDSHRHVVVFYKSNISSTNVSPTHQQSRNKCLSSIDICK